jgi:drug/metabolite transporter (DMT)-like permease
LSLALLAMTLLAAKTRAIMDLKSHGATLAGLGAVLLWGLLALFTAGTAGIPPFQLSALTFGIATVLGLAYSAVRGKLGDLLQPWPFMLTATLGLFGYHACYFAALKNAPPAEASLIAYLWPLLLVVFSGFLPGEKLLPRHVLAALIGFSGVALLAFAKEGGIGFRHEYAIGYGLAFCCALIWSSYSVATRRFATTPTEAITTICLITAVLSLLCHFAFERWVTPSSLSSWLAVVGLGLGPVGAAFFLWDYGMKRGDIRLIGTASFCAPAISTLALVLGGTTPLTWVLVAACGLILLATFVAARKT